MRLKTLGRLALDGSAFKRPKPLLVLAYLAMEGPRTRRQLAELFWAKAADGRDSLQTTVRRLSKVAPGLVTGDGDYLHADVTCDSMEFEAAVDAHDWVTALSLYTGPFLEDVNTSFQEEIEEWVHVTRERLARRAAACHIEVADQAVRSRDWAAGRSHAEQAFALASGGDWSGPDLERIVGLLDVTKSPLHQAAKRELDELMSWKPGAQEPELSAFGPARRSNLPYFASSFHGRDEEMDHLTRLLSETPVRLMTIHGPGGVGKSRLAVECGHRLLGSHLFAHGVYFVPLEAASDRETAAVAIANALFLGLSTQLPEPHVIAAIGPKELLLILDNYEHLAGGNGLVAALVRSCPNVTVLVTSRHTLNLPEEHILALSGLSTSGAIGDPEALQLLAARLDQQVSGSGRDLDRVAGNRICELVGGNPLGIELAAANARYLTLAHLADVIGAGLEPLVNRDSTALERHASMNASLRVSWELLSEDQRRALADLTVFRGGIDTAASMAVANVDLTMLSSLVDHALVRMGSGGRFELHPLIHAFADGRLAESVEASRRVNKSHARHFLSWVARLGHEVLGGETAAEALTSIETELANIERAWNWAVETNEVGLLEAAAWPLAHLGELRGRYHAAVALLETAVEPLEAAAAATLEGAAETAQRALGSVLGCLSFLSFRVGAIDRARAFGERAVAILVPRRLSSGNWGLWSAYQGLAMTNLSLSQHAAATRYLAAGIELAHVDAVSADGDEVNVRIADIAVGISVQTLAFLALAAGDHHTALSHLQRATALFEPHKAPHLSYVYWQTGRLYSELGDNLEARGWLEKGLEFAHEIEFRSLVGHTLDNLARVHLRLGEVTAALEDCRQGLILANDSGDKWLLTSLLAVHGLSLKASGDLWGGRSEFLASLEVAQSFDGYSFAMEALAGLADPTYHVGRDGESVTLLAFVAASAYSPRYVADEASVQMSRLESALGQKAYLQAVERGRSIGLEDALALAFEASNVQTQAGYESRPLRDPRSN